MKLRKHLAALTAAVTAIAAIPLIPFRNDVEIHAEDEHTHIHEESELPVPVPVIRSETSEYGLVETIIMNEDGTSAEQNLVPERLPKATVIPASYDLRDKGILTPVKNQEQTGTCWIHGGLAAGETSLILKGIADTSLNLSEAHVAWFTHCYLTQDKNDVFYQEGESFGYVGTDRENKEDGYDEGGNYHDLYSTLGRWTGAVIQSAGEEIWNYPQFNESQRYDMDYTFVNSDLIDAEDHSTIKERIMTTGPLCFSYLTKGENGEEYFNEKYNAHYAYNAETTNHLVTIVGWDDNFSKSKFLKQPAGNGAWICRNSWGEDFGEDGYFYLSYYDTSFSEVFSMDMVSGDKYDNNYQCKANDDRIFTSRENGFSIANIYTAKGFETMKAVGIRTYSANEPYTIRVYLNSKTGSPMNGQLVHIQSGNIEYAGYHTIDLTTGIPLAPGQKFTVIVSNPTVGTWFGIDSVSNTEGVSYFAMESDIAGNTYWYPCGINGSYTGEVGIRVLTSDNLMINASSFPDAAFRSYISSSIDKDCDGTLSASEIAAVTTLNVSNMGIEDLSGIEYFTSITTLYCNNNKLKYIRLENNAALVNLYCSGNSCDIGSVSCKGFTVSGLDMSKVTVTSGGKKSGISFVPDAGAESITYQYTCKNGISASFTLNFSQTHTSTGSDGKCKNCGVQVFYAKVISSNVVSYYRTLQDAIDYAENSDESVTVSLLDSVSGNYLIESGDFTVDNNSLYIVSWNENPALKITGGNITFKSAVIYNMSTGTALQIDGGDVAIQDGFYEEGDDDEGTGLTVNGGTVTITGGRFSVNGTGTAINSKKPINSLLPTGYVICDYESSAVVAEKYITGTESQIYSIEKSAIAGLHSSHDFNSGTSVNTQSHTAICDQCGITEKQSHSLDSWAKADELTHISSCIICHLKVTGSHNMTKWSDAGAAGHSRKCADCGYTETSKHTFNEWTESEGKHIRICTECGAVETSLHTFGEWTDNEDGTHSRSCTYCGVKESGKHNFGDWTESENGTHSRTCKDCGVSEKIGHSFGEWTDNEDGTHSRSCTYCGAKESGKHNFGDWTESENGTHSRTCNDCGVSEKIGHSFGEWTDNEDGTHSRSCTYCGAKESGKHNFGDWIKSENGKHTRSCTECGNSASYIIGDIINDNIIDAFDLVMLRRIILNGCTSDYQRAVSDINLDGETNIADLVYLQQYILGKITK